MGRRKGLTFYQRKKKLNMVLIKEIASWIFWMFVSAFLAIVLVFCMGMKTNVIGSSMEPCLYNGQEIFLNRVIYRLSSPKIGDVVVFRPNGNEKAHYYVKRVLAIPGDTVQVKGGILYVNGETQEDYFNDKIAEPGIAENLIELGPSIWYTGRWLFTGRLSSGIYAIWRRSSSKTFTQKRCRRAASWARVAPS